MDERDEKAAKITDNWIANNYQYEDLKKLITSFGIKEKSRVEQGPTTEEIQKDWSKLAKFMSGRR